MGGNSIKSIIENPAYYGVRGATIEIRLTKYKLRLMVKEQK